MELKLLVDGAGPHLPLVLIHGWGHSLRVWETWLAAKAASRQVYGVNLPGFDPDDDIAPTAPNLAAMLTEITARLPAACIVLGWSLGGMLACQLARSPKVKGLLTLAANPSFIARPHWPWAMAPELLQQFQEAFTSDPQATQSRFNQLQAQGHSERKALLNTVKNLAPPIQAAAWSETLNWLGQIDNSRLLAQLNIPQRHLFAEQDALVPVAAALHCAHSRRIAGGHLLPLVAGEAINQALSELDRAQNRTVAKAFSQAAGVYDQHAQLQQRLGRQLITQLTPAQLQILDLGCGTGFIQRSLANRANPPWVVNLDLAWGMLSSLPDHSSRLQADAELLPFATASFDAITANLSLQWCHLPQVLSEAKRCLRPGGSLLFNTLTEGTLESISAAWAQVDQYPHINSFPTQAQVLAQCQQAGFTALDWQAQREYIYADDLTTLLMTIKGIGAKNRQPQRYKGLMSSRRWRAFGDAMHSLAWDGQRWFVSYEVLTLCLRN